jgi:hypothetical protein
MDLSNTAEGSGYLAARKTTSTFLEPKGLLPHSKGLCNGSNPQSAYYLSKIHPNVIHPLTTWPS